MVHRSLSDGSGLIGAVQIQGKVQSEPSVMMTHKTLLVSAVIQLVHWGEPKKSAAAFCLSLIVLVAVATLSVISVVSYVLLACLCVTITFRWVGLRLKVR